MQKHTMTLQEDEFKLVQRIRKMNKDTVVKKRLIDQLIQEIEDFLVSQSSKKITWLQVGDKQFFQPIEPVKPEPGAPLASEIILEHRQRRV